MTIQNETQEALQKLINGVPEFWQQLVEEAYRQSVLAAIIHTIIMLVAGFIAYRLISKDSFEKYDMIIIISSFIAFINGALAISRILHAVAPSVTLLRTI
jgi:hypothetical protein